MNKYYALTFMCWITASPIILAQPTNKSTKGDNSPIIQTAKSFHATYGVRADVIYAILRVYENEEPSSKKRIERTEQLIKQYTQTPERKHKSPVLSENSKKQLGIQKNPAISEALEWDLYATPRYLSSYGDNSPIINANGDVNIWYGISPEAVRALAKRLDADKTIVTDFEKRLEVQIKKYEELRKSLVNREDELGKEAKNLLDEGKIEEAVQVLKDRRYGLRKITERSKKREAEGAFDYAEGLELEMKYDSAAFQFKDAVDLDMENAQYLLNYAYNEERLAHYSEAIRHYHKILFIDTISSVQRGRVYHNIGSVFLLTNQCDSAMIYFNKSLTIEMLSFKNNHPSLATTYNSIGGAWACKGSTDSAILFYKKALYIDSIALGVNHPELAFGLNNIGSIYLARKDYDQAIPYFQKAFSFFQNSKHYSAFTSIVVNNIGGAFNGKGDFETALTFYLVALGLDTMMFKEKHPNVARDYNNIGGVYVDMKEYDLGIEYTKKALSIYGAIFGTDHRTVGDCFYNIGDALARKSEFDQSSQYFEKAINICNSSFYKTHPYCKNIALKISQTSNEQGMKYFREKKYATALPYFIKALEYAQFAEDGYLFVICFNNIGSSKKWLGAYAEGLDFLEKGIAQAQLLDLKTGRKDGITIIRRMRYHTLGCLTGLNRKEEASQLAVQLQQEALENADIRLLNDLKNDGYINK